MADSLFDDQELSEKRHGLRHPPPREDEQITRGLAICRHEHRRISVTWHNRVARGDVVYNLCLDCNMLYTQDWEGGGQYTARALLGCATPTVQDRITTVSRFFYRGWPRWWLTAHGVSPQDVDLSITTRNQEGG